MLSRTIVVVLIPLKHQCEPRQQSLSEINLNDSMTPVMSD
jgi:hypothetical protein